MKPLTLPKRPRQRLALQARKPRIAWVRRAPQNPGSHHKGLLCLGGKTYPCALGRSGITGLKNEGDGATPRGRMALLGAAYRPDRARLPSADQSFWQRIEARDAWSDAPFTPAYNQWVSLPHKTSHEVMRREDHLYDRLIVLDWNIRCRAQLRGSAIFMHQARRDQTGQMKPTEGCIALPAPVFARLAPQLARLDAVQVF